MKIPTVFEIDKEIDNRIGNLEGYNPTGQNNPNISNTEQGSTGYKYTYPNGVSNNQGGSFNFA